MTILRASALTIDTLRTRVRREVEDPTTDGSGNARPTGLLTFQTAEIDDAINDALRKLANLHDFRVPGNALVPTTLSYSETVVGEGVALPAAVGADSINHVEDISATDNIPRPVHYVPPAAIEQYQTLEAVASSEPLGTQYYTLVGSSTGTNIKIRPRITSARNYRIWSIAAPLVTNAAGDQPLLSNRWCDLIVLEAAILLLRRSGRATDQQIMAHNGQLALYSMATRQQGDDFVRNVRGRNL